MEGQPDACVTRPGRVAGRFRLHPAVGMVVVAPVPCRVSVRCCPVRVVRAVLSLGGVGVLGRCLVVGRISPQRGSHPGARCGRGCRPGASARSRLEGHGLGCVAITDEAKDARPRDTSIRRGGSRRSASMLFETTPTIGSIRWSTGRSGFLDRAVDRSIREVAAVTIAVSRTGTLDSRLDPGTPIGRRSAPWRHTSTTDQQDPAQFGSVRAVIVCPLLVCGGHPVSRRAVRRGGRRAAARLDRARHPPITIAARMRGRSGGGIDCNPDRCYTAVSGQRAADEPARSGVSSAS